MKQLIVYKKVAIVIKMLTIRIIHLTLQVLLGLVKEFKDLIQLCLVNL